MPELQEEGGLVEFGKKTEQTERRKEQVEVSNFTI